MMVERAKISVELNRNCSQAALNPPLQSYSRNQIGGLNGIRLDWTGSEWTELDWTGLADWKSDSLPIETLESLRNDFLCCSPVFLHVAAAFADGMKVFHNLLCGSMGFHFIDRDTH